MDDEENFLSYFASLMTKSEMEVEIALCNAPPLTQALVACPSVCGLLKHVLNGNVSALQVHVVRSLIHALDGEPEQKFPSVLWIEAVLLLGSSHLDIVKPAMDLVVQFSSVERLEDDTAKNSFESVLRIGKTQELRVLETMARLAAKSQDIMNVPMVLISLQRLIQTLCESDLLWQLNVLELLITHVVTQPWSLRFLLEAKVHERAMVSISPKMDSSTDQSFLHLVGSIAAQGEVGYHAIASTNWHELCSSALHHHSRLSQSCLDGVLCVVEGVACGCEAGQLRVVEFVTPIIHLISNDDIDVRVRACRSLATVLKACAPVSPSGNRVLEEIVGSPLSVGLGSRLLALAQHAILQDQSISAFQLLIELIEKLPQWCHETTPSLFTFVIDHHLTVERVAVPWRYGMANAYLAHGNEAALALLGTQKYDLLVRFLKSGPHDSNNNHR